MNSKVYKWCGVPQCKNTSIKTPNKLFVFVPLNNTTRNKWLKLARRDSKAILSTSHLYFCEDHFDLPNVMDNYMEYHLMGRVSQIRMKPGCMPTKFQCQPDRIKRTSDATERPYILKKQRKTLIEECRKDLEEISTKQVELEEVSCGSSEMVRCRAEYMRAYREKKREEKLKSQSEEPKKIARNSTQRSRDFRARAAALRLSQTSTVDPSSALPNLVVSDEVSHLGQEVQHTENIFSENTFESYIAKVDKTNLSIDPLSSNVKQEKTLDEFENNIAVWIETDEFENFKSTSAVDNIKQELEETESLPDDNTFETYISRVVNVDSSSHPVKEEINAEVWIKTEDDSENLSIDNSVIDNIKQEFEDTGSISNENTFETYISRVVHIDPSNHPVKEEINADVWIKTEDE